MNRIKVVNEPAELVPVLRAVDSDIKRAVFNEVSTDWKTLKEIEEKFGAEGKEALLFFEKMKLVETRWQTIEGGPEKAYHTYYLSFHINTTCPVTEISDVLSAAVMSDEDFKKIEEHLYESCGENGKFAGDVADDLGVSATMLKGLVKRSLKLEYRGHRIERSRF